MIDIKNLKKSFGKKEILKGVNLKINEGATRLNTRQTRRVAYGACARLGAKTVKKSSKPSAGDQKPAR